ncbi:MAG: hypothetical protein QNJ47_16185 [Nostocaceae cyanobacterium]|nr:hypothetical protein [Nostocaceae cyanobacterium]
MHVNVDTKKRGRFIEPLPYVALGASALVFLALITSPFFKKTLVNKNVTVNKGQPVKIETLELKSQSIGALRVDAEALIRTNQWVTYEIQLFDSQGKLLASGIKEAWRESGIWREGGESGSWSQSDLRGGIDVRAKQNEKLTVAINVLGYGDSRGRELNLAVPLRVKVENGVVDTRHLWPGLFGSLALAVMSLISTRYIGKVAIAKTINDSDPSGRGELGGAKKLVRVNVNIEADETSPRELEVKLVINDSYGELVYRRSYPVKVNFKRENGKIEKATAELQAFFILDKPDSYGFHVEVLPDSPIDRTSLKVRNSARTLRAVDVVRIVPKTSDV